MNVHVVVDFQYIYYKNKFSYASRRRLSYVVNGEEVDTTMIYLPLKELEGYRSELERKGHNVTMSICFDSKTERKEGTDYKANRDNRPSDKKLQDEDYHNIDIIRQLLSEVGYNVYKVEGMEADDLVYTIVQNHKHEFDYTVVYSIDKDAAINVDYTVGLRRYKTNLKSFQQLYIDSYSDILSEEFNANISYNQILLFLASVGDHSDNVHGIKGFGPSAWNKMSEALSIVRCRSVHDCDVEIERICTSGYLNDNQVDELRESYRLVRPITVDGLVPVVKADSQQTREKAYGVYAMKSLYKD